MEVYEQALKDWGENLLQEFPDALPQPNFDANYTERFIWYSKGLSLGVVLASTIGAGGKVYAGKLYDSIETLTDADQLDIARNTYKQATVYWSRARQKKVAADSAAEAVANQKATLDMQIGAFRASVQSIHSREKLRFEIDALKATIGANKAAPTMAQDYLSSGKLLALHDRLIALEGKESRLATSGWWITLAGTISGLIGLAIGYLAGSSG